MKAATSLGHGLSEEPEDLMQEALFRAISGARICPARMEVRAFLYGVMRSLANAARKQGGSVRFVPLDDESAGEVSADASVEFESRRRIREILRLFDEQPFGRRVVTLQFEGYRGAEIMQRTGLSRRQLDAALRQIRRRIERAKKEGKL